MPIEPFGIERFFAKHEFSTPHLLGVSDCESMAIGDLLELEPGADRGLTELRLGYTESEGGIELRKAIAATYQGLGPEHILVHAAGVEVIYALAHAVLGKGDHAIVQTPCYQILRSAPAMTGAEVSLWAGRPEDDWAPDPRDLARLIRPETRLIVINTPHNPTGHQFDREDLEWLLQMGEERGILILVDEAYRGAEYDPTDRLPSAAELSESACSLGLLSKGYGLPGLRVAWLATRNAKVRQAVSIFKDYTTICSPGPSEYLGALALRHSEVLLGRTRERLKTNLALLEIFMDKYSDIFDWVPPQAGPITFPRLTSGSAADFSARLREEAGVLVVPGGLFDAKCEAIRIGFGRAAFPAGLEVMDQWMEQKLKR